MRELEDTVADELFWCVAQDTNGRRTGVLDDGIGADECVSIPTVLDNRAEAVQRLILRLLALELSDLLRSSEQLNEDLDLGTKDFRHQRFDEIVHGTEGVRLGRSKVLVRERGYENDRRVPRPLLRADALSNLEAIHAVQTDIEQHDGEIIREQKL